MNTKNIIVSSIYFFHFQGKITNIKEYGNGHINKTFLVETTEGRYIYQIINSYAFGDVEMLMKNINIVTKHLAKNGQETLEVVKTFDGANYYSDKQYYYRMYTFVENTVCYEEITDLKLVRKAGEAFGDLHVKLEGVNPNSIFEIIKDFHNTPVRYNNMHRPRPFAKNTVFGNRQSFSCAELSPIRRCIPGLSGSCGNFWKPNPPFVKPCSTKESPAPGISS